ncbi:uncharacterized protein LOC136040577 isoform X4 [Artemia franciscana]|uniref:uncharacterized protein LOC136040577 isoform X4 n=1 Tax=Artemia franciscana TaxID=6661 RepID=UPI0032DA0EE0
MEIMHLRLQITDQEEEEEEKDSNNGEKDALKKTAGMAGMKAKLGLGSSAKKIDSPYAKYTHGGLLLSCSLCNISINSELFWTAHISGRQHRENIAKFQKPQSSSKTALGVKRKAEFDDRPAVKRKETLPEDFFDKSDSRAKPASSFVKPKSILKNKPTAVHDSKLPTTSMPALEQFLILAAELEGAGILKQSSEWLVFSPPAWLPLILLALEVEAGFELFASLELHHQLLLVPALGIRDEFVQRSILACAEELCDQAKKEKSEEVPDTLLVPASQHRLQETTFDELTPCDKCHKFLRGLLHQVLICQCEKDALKKTAGMAGMKAKLGLGSSAKKIDSPYAKYTHGGLLLSCSLCNISINSELFWTAHISGRQHRENIAKFQKPQSSSKTALGVKRKAEFDDRPAVKRKETLPEDFFDKSDSRAKPASSFVKPKSILKNKPTAVHDSKLPTTSMPALEQFLILAAELEGAGILKQSSEWLVFSPPAWLPLILLALEVEAGFELFASLELHHQLLLVPALGIRDEFVQRSMLACAEELCDQAKKEKSEEVPDTLLVPASQHRLQETTFDELTPCDKCHKFLRGLLHQVLICQCKFYICSNLREER